MTLGLVGRKLGMTRIFTDDGKAVPVTVLDVANNRVTQIKTPETDGYAAVQVAFGKRRASRVSKPQAGHLAKAGVEAGELLREFPVSPEALAEHKLGATIGAGTFAVGELVDVTGTTKGRGFTGVMRRHHFAGNVRTHGTHEYRRHGGSIGTNMTPGRVKLGMKMPGQHGNKTRSVLSQKIVKVIAEKNLILIHGGVPGARDGLVFVRGAVKKRGGKPAAK